MSTSSSACTRQHSNMSEDERRRKRALSNREAAKRSRMKKQQRLEELTAEAERLKEENRRMLVDIEVCGQRCMRLEGENGMMRAQVMALRARLETLGWVMRCIVGGRGMETMGMMSAPEPWEAGSSAQAIPVSADMFR